MEFQSEFWFRVYQVAAKVVPFLFGALLLLPLALLFWNMVWYQPQPAAERQAALEALAQKGLAEVQSSAAMDDPHAVGAVGVMVITEEKVGIALSRFTGAWLAYYPRFWVGVCGLVAVAFLLVLIGFSAFLPTGITPSAVSHWETDALPPDTEP